MICNDKMFTNRSDLVFTGSSIIFFFETSINVMFYLEHGKLEHANRFNYLALDFSLPCQIKVYIPRVEDGKRSFFTSHSATVTISV